MTIIANILISIVALLHIYILILEMFLWTKPMGMKAFRMNKERAESTAILAANQGLYNGFLAAGLIWSVLNPHETFSFQLSLFFLGCVLIAALYGAYSVGKKILLIQGVPAILALIATVIAHY
jgi:putative membrane protein